MLYPMKRILACTDFSEGADAVIMAADELARLNGGTVEVLYVSELGIHLGQMMNAAMRETYRSAFLGDLTQAMEKRMKDQLYRCGSSAKPVYRDGSVDGAILELAESGNYDLLVMGHGQKPIYKQFLGSNAVKVISGTPLPLLIVKKPLRLKKVAGLVDESRPRDRVIIGTLDFLRNFKVPEATIVSLWQDFPEPFGNPDGGAGVAQKLEEEVSHFKHAGESVKIVVEPTKELKLAYPLEKILKERMVDVAVVKRFSEGNLKRAYLGSTTKRLLEIFEGNLLVLPPEQ